MNSSLKNKCELFVANHNAMKKAFKWDSMYTHPLCAYLYAEKGLSLDIAEIRAARDIIKRSTGIFSNFRSISRNIFATMLSLEASPDVKFSDIQSVYSKLKKEFFSSNYLPLAAFLIVRIGQPGDYDAVVLRAKTIYKLMKAEHPFLTTSEDCTYAALFALSDKSQTDMVCEAESCYTILKQRFFSSNAVQSLSHVLAVGEERPEEKCTRVMELYELLGARNLKYGTRYELATLGVLALSGVNSSIIADNIAQANEFMKTSKGFGIFGIGAKQRLMYAAMLTASEYSSQASDSMNTAALNSVTSLLIASQAAVTAAIAAGSSAAVANS